MFAERYFLKTRIIISTLVLMLAISCSKDNDEPAPCKTPCKTESLPIDNSIVGHWRWTGCSGGGWGGTPTYPGKCEMRDLYFGPDGNLLAMENGDTGYYQPYITWTDTSEKWPEVVDYWLQIDPINDTMMKSLYEYHIESNYLSLNWLGGRDLPVCSYKRCK